MVDALSRCPAGGAPEELQGTMCDAGGMCLCRGSWAVGHPAQGALPGAVSVGLSSSMRWDGSDTVRIGQSCRPSLRRRGR